MPLPISELRESFQGRVVAPEDPDYDEVRKVFLGDVDRRPAVIIRAADGEPLPPQPEHPARLTSPRCGRPRPLSR